MCFAILTGVFLTVFFFNKVELCTDFGDPNKARPWSKHSRQPSSKKDKEEKSQDETDEKVFVTLPLSALN